LNNLSGVWSRHRHSFSKVALVYAVLLPAALVVVAGVHPVTDATVGPLVVPA
jgi:cytochrome c oxidase subunit IV